MPASTASRCCRVDVNASDWDCTLEARMTALAVRLAVDCQGIVASRGRDDRSRARAGPFRGRTDDFARRTRLEPRGAVPLGRGRRVSARLALIAARGAVAGPGRGKNRLALPLFATLERRRAAAVPCRAWKPRKRSWPIIARPGCRCRAHPIAIPAPDIGRLTGRAGQPTWPRNRRTDTSAWPASCWCGSAQHGQGDHVRDAGRRNGHGQSDRAARRVAALPTHRLPGQSGHRHGRSCSEWKA